MKKKFSVERKKDLVSKLSSWWHSIELGDGVVTPGCCSLEVQRPISLALPDNLQGKSVLDIGCNNGLYSFLCEKKGAKVTAIDNSCHFLQGCYTARKILNSGIKIYGMDLFDLPKKMNRAFDVVLFCGVLYHLKHPLKALEILFSATKELLILESHYIETDSKVPMMRLYPGKELNNDPTNWWGPNIQCLIDMLKIAGFKRPETIVTYPFDPKENSGRVIIKAYKI